MRSIYVINSFKTEVLRLTENGNKTPAYKLLSFQTKSTNAKSGKFVYQQLHSEHAALIWCAYHPQITATVRKQSPVGRSVNEQRPAKNQSDSSQRTLAPLMPNGNFTDW